jgi:Nif-specific regulatory protein
VRLLFNLESAETDQYPTNAPAAAARTPPVRPAGEVPPSHDETALQPDELMLLYRFMTDSMYEDTPQGLVSLALRVLLRHTRANLAGFLSLESDGPELLVVLPEQGAVDKALSRHLTQRVLREGQAVWLNKSRSALESDSLSNVSDALCVPLRLGPISPAGSGAGPDAPTLGALHVYKSNRPFGERELFFCQVLAANLAGMLHGLRARRALVADNHRLRGHAPSAPSDTLVGSSPAMRQLREQIAKLADCPCNVLILGENGVGKEVVAMGLHRQSRRRDEPMVPVNCAAICSSLFESQLFGHKRGSFTGAVGDSPGLFLQADMGTLFLDEVGELSLDVQAKLLRALETKRFTPVGGNKEVIANVRILAATNRDLERDAQDRTFRKDLFYRLRVAEVRVPPLREHREDIPELVEHFLRSLNQEYRRRVELTEGAMQRLLDHSWPGNVRQLRSVLETAVAMADDYDTIKASDLHLETETTMPCDRPPSLDLEAVEEWAIREALARTNWNNTHAARVLNIHRETLINKIRKYRITRPANGEGR